jgi:hypothetical protein
MRRILIAVLAMFALLGPAYAAGSPWTEYPGPAPGPGTNQLLDVEAASDSLAWAVGRAGTGHLLLKWDGVAWSAIPVEAPVAGTSALLRVHAVSSSSAWAVGFDHGQPWILRYKNGSWTTFSTAGLPSGRLTAVATTSKGVPVVVTGSSSYAVRAKIAKWNGSSWVLGSLPIPKSDHPSSYGTAISLVPGSGDAFVIVGSASGTFGAWAVRGRPGGAWQDFSPPSSVTGQGPGGFVYTTDHASDVYVVNQHDITLVGTAVTTSDVVGPAPGQRPIVARWNGTSWSREKLSSVYGDSINAIAVHPGKSRLVVGYNDQTHRADAFEFVPGTGWKRLASPPAGSALYAVAAIPGTTSYWAVGSKGTVNNPPQGWPYYSEDSTYLLRH